MARRGMACLLFLCCTSLLWCTTRAGSSFSEKFKTVWGQQHVRQDASGLKMVLDNSTGSAIRSYDKYMYGYISMRMKLVPGDSAGVVTTFYLSSMSKAHDELDLEFLGNRSGQPYILHTNIFVNGVGGREQRIYLWFDPSADYHTYALLWNRYHLVFMVDNVPIRVLKRTAATIFPSQGMYIFSSIWDASDWATRGGRDKTNWWAAPFTARLADYRIDSCSSSDGRCIANSWQRWWSSPRLSWRQERSYAWVRRNFMVYDYCSDKKRYPTPPAECLVGDANDGIMGRLTTTRLPN